LEFAIAKVQYNLRFFAEEHLKKVKKKIWQSFMHL